ncbi:hypothetical protein ABVK25_006211 [Lepraria finkii]|uniref:Uncharacterized protein n=1 Tax=Lepraria finkii TaxID=1340010 RepID=A0ABR4B6V0_9LECA
MFLYIFCRCSRRVAPTLFCHCSKHLIKISDYLTGLIVTLNIASALAAGVQFAGVNIAGFDFGCTIDGTCTSSSVDPRLGAYGGGDGSGQMNHFTMNDKLEIFRLPVAGQYLVNNQFGGTLDAANFGQ